MRTLNTARTPILQRTMPIRIGRHERSVTVRLSRPTRRRIGEYACTYERVSRQLRESRTRLALGMVVVELEALLRDQHGTIAPLWEDLRRLGPQVA